MAKRKRKVSAATLRNLARGRAKRRANLKRSSTRTRTTRKRKSFKVQRRSSTMAKRRRSRSRSRGSSLGFGKPLAMLSSAGRAFAVGLGTKMVLDELGQQFNVPQVSKFSNIAGGLIAFQEGKGLPGIAAAFPFISKVTRGVTNGNGGTQAGSGAFV